MTIFAHSIRQSFVGLILTLVCMASLVFPTAAMHPSPKLSNNGSAPVPVSDITSGSNTNNYSATGHAALDADTIRVGISDDGMQDYEYSEALISATRGFTLLNQGNVILTGTANQPVRVTVSSAGFKVETQGKTAGTYTGPIRLVPDNGGLCTIPGITRRKRVPEYKGILELTRGYSSPARLSVVNILPLQEYLKAVVPNELPPHYGYEAVKAQSVAARNYAIRPREKSYPQFDICDSQYCQVYFGAQTEHPSSNRALAETHGLVALYDGRPILALYSSAHGGHSESYENVFSDTPIDGYPGSPVPYLQGKPDIISAAQPFGDLSVEENARRFWTTNVKDFDGKSSFHRWEKQWSITELSNTLTTQWNKLLKKKNTAAFLSGPYNVNSPPSHVDLGTIKRITVNQRGVSGKVMSLTLSTTTGDWTAQKEFVIRNLFIHQGRMLQSANVVFSHLTAPDGTLVAIRANGGGFGHGVGMSQLGASTLSDRAKRFDEILKHYYSHISIGSIPVHVGPLPQNSTTVTHPQRVTFVVPHYSKQPTLFVQSSQPLTSPPVVELNTAKLTIPFNSSRDQSVSPPPQNETATPVTDGEGTLLSELSQLIKRLENGGTPSSPTTTPSTGSRSTHAPQYRLAVPLSPTQLLSGQLNTLTLHPLPEAPNTSITVWVELIPADS